MIQNLIIEQYEDGLVRTITIGDMIETITKKMKIGCDLRILYEGVISEVPGKMMWCVSIVEYEEKDEELHEHKKEFQADELSDALWSTLNFILKEEK